MLEFLTREAHQRDGAILRAGDRVRVHYKDLSGERTGTILNFDLTVDPPLGRVKFDDCSATCCAESSTLSGGGSGIHSRYDVDLLELLS